MLLWAICGSFIFNLKDAGFPAHARDLGVCSVLAGVFVPSPVVLTVCGIHPLDCWAKLPETLRDRVVSGVRKPSPRTYANLSAKASFIAIAQTL